MLAWVSGFTPMTVLPAPLSRFHPLLAQWFRHCVGEPTDVQEQAWPRIAAGEHVLVTAPTGTGKTLTAFFWALDRLLTGAWPTGRVAVLYVSPLRALNTDIQRNLLGPLTKLQQRFADNGTPAPEIRVLTRSGDTPASERQRMLRHPPEILITTPESLNLLLSSRGGLDLLTGLRCVVLDEIHALVDSKRGTHLITAVERLVRRCGEFQRIALSATVRPAENVARFVGGYVRQGNSAASQYEPRSVSVVRSGHGKRYDIEVCFPEALDDASLRDEAWAPLTEELRQRIAKNRSTLVFVDSRRMAEKITRLINAAEGELVAYAHHGSLSREIRSDVESRLKAGELRAIVSTSSLEMGIDIGAIDEVVQILPPPTVAAAIQRAGRAGHQVGRASHTSLYGVHAMHVVETAVVARKILEHDIEPIAPVLAPVDVLAQVITSMVGVEARDVDEVYAELRSSTPYHDLSRRQFDLVVDMLAGRYADAKLRDLRARVSFDRTENTLKARRGAVQALYSSGGTIPDRGEFKLRNHQGNALIGTLDEEFVWEAKVGDNFLLGTQSWQIQAITHNDVFVTPAGERGKAPPFWRGEEQSRGYHLSEQIGEFLEQAEMHVGARDLDAWLREGFCLSEHAATQVAKFLRAQREHTRTPLPHRHHLLVEHVARGPSGAPGHQLILHTLWGGRVNRPYAMALESAWTQRFGQRPEIFVGNDAVVLQLAEAVPNEELLSLVRTDNVESHLRSRLEGSGFFGARFREAAGRAMLLPKRKFGERLPLWMTRLRAQQLFEAVRHYGDFPIMLEAWRSCLQDELDLPSLLAVLGELESGAITVRMASVSTASPMAKVMSWAQVSDYMYRRDEPKGLADRPSVRDDLLAEVAHTDSLRPRIPRAIADELASKLQRTAPGYPPRDADELRDWVEDRLALPFREWEDLLAAMRREQSTPVDTIVAELDNKLWRVHVAPSDAAANVRGATLVVERATLSRLRVGWYGRCRLQATSLVSGKAIELDAVEPAADGDELPLSLLGQVLSFYSPISPVELAAHYGLASLDLEAWTDALEGASLLVRGPLVVDDDTPCVCDVRNFETLLRITRAKARPSFAALEPKWLAPFLARIQGVGARRSNDDPVDTLAAAAESLLCLPLPAAQWEADVWPARVPGYRGDMVDRLLAESDLCFVGGPSQRIGWCYSAELDVFPRAPDDDATHDDATPNDATPNDATPNDATPNDATTTDDDEASTSNPTPASGDTTSSDPAPWRSLFADPKAGYDLAALTFGSGRLTHEVVPALWAGVWAGQVTCQSFAPVRRGLETGFAVDPIVPSVPGRRPLRARGRRHPTPAGTWRLLANDRNGDALDQQERDKDRVRLLLDRYGVLFRQLLLREAPEYRYGSLFRSLRLMELSGELLAGQFFLGIDGLQFISHEGFRRLIDGLGDEPVFWLNACDPASLCGLGLAGLPTEGLRRIQSTHLVYRGPELVMVSRKSGRELEFFVEPDDARLSEYVEVLRHLLARSHAPLRRIRVDSINGRGARHSVFVAPLRALFDVDLGPRDLTLAPRRAG